MNFLRSYLACLFVVAGVLLATPASAQSTQKPKPTPTPSQTAKSPWTDRLSAGINFGLQTGSGDWTYRSTPQIYGETATIDVTQDIGTGFLFDVGATYLVYDNFGVGLSYSRAASSGDAAVSAQVPDPLDFDRPRPVTTSASGLNHSEGALHLTASYRFAATPKIDVIVGLGPTFYSVTQEIVGTLDVSEGASGPTVTPRITEGSEATVGFHLGADVTYMINKRYGAGVLLRFGTGSADITTDSGTVEVDAGGFQLAGGLRIRF